MEALYAKKAKTRKKIKKVGMISFALIIVLAASYFLYFADLFKYNKAIDCLKQAKHQEAYDLFKELGDFKDSETYFKKFEWVAAKKNFDSDRFTEYQYNKDGLIGKVITTFSGNKESYEYKYNKEGQIIKQIYTQINGEQVVTEYLYNKEGKIIKQTLTSHSGSQRVTEYQYNKEGQVSKNIHTYNDGNQYVIEYQYNKDGLVTLDGYGFEYKYNEDGLVTEKHYNSVMGGEPRCTKYQYNKDGLVIKATTINRSNDKTVSVIEYQYNDAGLLIKQTENSAGGYQRVTEYQHKPVYKKFGKAPKTEIIFELSLSPDLRDVNPSPSSIGI